MTTVRIAHAAPRPGAQPDGRFLVSHYLVVLTEAVADDADASRRALPLWLEVPGGDSLWQLLSRPARDPVMAGVMEETAVRLLDAAGVAVTAVDLRVTSQDAAELRSADVTARVALSTADGTRHVTVSAGYGLALATASGAPVQVADVVLGRLGVPGQDDDLVTPFLPAAFRPAVFLKDGTARTQGRPPRRWRFEPRNLTFTDGLDRWELFSDGRESDRHDYSAAGNGSLTLASAVEEPRGFAVLVQTIFADDYRGRTVTFRGELRTHDVAGHAALHLATGRPTEPPGHHLRNRGARGPAATGSSDWTWHEIAMLVPGDADLVRFGLSLTGRGRVELRNTELRNTELAGDA